MSYRRSPSDGEKCHTCRKYQSSSFWLQHRESEELLAKILLRFVEAKKKVNPVFFLLYIITITETEILELHVW